MGYRTLPFGMIHLLLILTHERIKLGSLTSQTFAAAQCEGSPQSPAQCLVSKHVGERLVSQAKHVHQLFLPPYQCFTLCVCSVYRGNTSVIGIP